VCIAYAIFTIALRIRILINNNKLIIVHNLLVISLIADMMMGGMRTVIV